MTTSTLSFPIGSVLNGDEYRAVFTSDGGLSNAVSDAATLSVATKPVGVTEWIGGSIVAGGQSSGGDPNAWSNSLNWNNGLPGPGRIAVFDPNATKLVDAFVNGDGSQQETIHVSSFSPTVDASYTVAGIYLDSSLFTLNVTNTLDVTGASEWENGNIYLGSGSVLSVDAHAVLTMGNNAEVDIAGGGELVNYGLLRQTGIANPLGIGSSTTLYNAPGATLDFEGDAGGITSSGTYGGFGIFRNAGILVKSAGTGTAGITIIAQLTETTQGVIHVAQGNLVLQPQAHGDGSASYQSANFQLDANTVLDLTGVDGNTVLVSGTLTFNGTGEVLFSHGTLQAVAGVATLIYPHVNFQWTSGELDGEWTNTGVLNLSGDKPKTVYENILHNQGSILQTGAGNLELTTDATLDNQPNALYDLQTDAGITGSTIYGGIGSIVNNGTLLKSVGTTATNSTIITHLTETAQGLIHLAQGNLVLQPQAHTDGSATYQSANFILNDKTMLDLTGVDGNTVLVSGTLTFNGTGEVLFSHGFLQAVAGVVTLNYPHANFQWTGGTLEGEWTNTGPCTCPAIAPRPSTRTPCTTRAASSRPEPATWN